MFKRLQSMFGRAPSAATATPPSIETKPKPKAPFYAIGDIHGCLAQMESLIKQIEAENANAMIVFLGDYIDRGTQSAQVLTRLRELQQTDADRFVCIMGNHERMMLEFIDDPLGRGARWLVNGGAQTLQSFGINPGKSKPDAEEAMELADQLEGALPKGMQNWLRDLPMQWSSGDVHCVHAAMDPTAAPDNQKERHLLWGHREFMTTPREDGACVVYGHVIVPKPDVRDGRIAIDTGAYKSGRLTAVHIDTDSWRFIQT